MFQIGAKMITDILWPCAFLEVSGHFLLEIAENIRFDCTLT